MLELGFAVQFRGTGSGFIFARKGVFNHDTFAFCVNSFVLSVVLMQLIIKFDGLTVSATNYVAVLAVANE